MYTLLAHDGLQYPLTDTPLRIGRQRDNTIVCMDALVSGYHAEIRPKQGGYVLVDLQSRNGTFVNGRPLTGLHPLSPGDVIRVGDSEFYFQAAAAPATAAAPSCPHCGAPLRPGAKFCGKCGQALTAVSDPGATWKMPDIAPPPYQPPPAYEPQPYTPQAYEPQAYAPQPYEPQAYTPQPYAPSVPPQYATPYKAAGGNSGKLNLSEALGFPFQAANWVMTFIIGSVLWLLPIIGMILLNGYAVEVARRVIHDHPDTLPDWDDWGTKFRDGLAVSVLGLVWSFIPFLIFSLPFILLTYTGRGLPVVFMGAGVLLQILATYFFLPAVMGRYAETGNFMAGLQVQAIVAQVMGRFGSYLGNWVLAGLMLIIGLTILGVLSAITSITIAFCVGICGIPLIFAISFYMVAFQGHILGQLYKTLM